MYVMKSEPLKFKLAATFRIKFKLIWTTSNWQKHQILYTYIVIAYQCPKIFLRSGAGCIKLLITF